MNCRHGGDIYNNKVSFDFSVNLNPLRCPPEVAEALAGAVENAGRYPDPGQSLARQAIGEWLGIPAGQLICTGGASEIFTLLVSMFRPSCVLLAAPCFGGYERACLTSAGCRIKRHMLSEKEDFVLDESILEELTEDVDMCFLCDPNNPTGQSVSPALGLRILWRCMERGIRLVADECFGELARDSISLIPHISEYDGLFVVRAFTKLLAIPGVRLGYLVSCEKNIEAFADHMPEWDLSVFAEAAAVSGAEVLKKGAYLRETVGVTETERAYLRDELTGLGIKVYPGNSCFLLIRSDTDLYGRLLEREILIRDCSDFIGLEKGYYRIAVKRHEENEILIDTLKEVL